MLYYFITLGPEDQDLKIFQPKISFKIKYCLYTQLVVMFFFYYNIQFDL